MFTKNEWTKNSTASRRVCRRYTWGFRWARAESFPAANAAVGRNDERNGKETAFFSGFFVGVLFPPVPASIVNWPALCEKTCHGLVFAGDTGSIAAAP